MKVEDFDNDSKRLIKEINRIIKLYFDGYYVDVSALLYNFKGVNNRRFKFVKYPELNKQFTALNNKLKIEIEAMINNGIAKGWELAELKGSAIDLEVSKYLESKGYKKKPVKPQNNNALEAYRKRKRYGLTLSDRVWNLTEHNRARIEDIIDIAITEGKSAKSLSKRLLEFLRNDSELHKLGLTNKEVKDKIAANKYGRGVYKNPESNALRLAQNEINIAYRTAEIERIKLNDDIVGYEVYLSPSHKVFDMCDILKGKYPKNFIFTHWHVGCMCNVRPILKTREELVKEMVEGVTLPASSSSNYVKTPHKDFYNYISENKEAINRLKHRPDWITENAKMFNVTGELK